MNKYYFKHDYDARNDPKMVHLMMIHGVAGVGIYWSIVEQLYENGGTIPMEQIDGIAFSLHTDKDTIRSVITDFNLFQNDGSIFWSESINERLGRTKQISESRKKAASTRWNNANAMQMHTKDMQMHEKPMQMHNEPMQMQCKSRILHKTQKNANGKTIQNEGVEIAKSVEENANAMQMHDNSMQMQCKTDDINNRIYNSTIPFSHSTIGNIDYKAFILFFNSEMDEANATIPRLKSLADKRKDMLNARSREHGNQAIAEMVRKAAKSGFLNGNNNRGWRADFSWLIRPNNFPKVIEGNYDNHEKQTNIGVVLTDNSENKYKSDTIKGW